MYHAWDREKIEDSPSIARRTSWAFLAEKKHQVFSPTAADET
jgi:hypothetical protein